ncbi:MAG: hypothetical protein ACTS4X_00370 [Candidatus Hodgkinia cicadicola]
MIRSVNINRVDCNLNEFGTNWIVKTSFDRSFESDMVHRFSQTQCWDFRNSFFHGVQRTL